MSLCSISSMDSDQSESQFYEPVYKFMKDYGNIGTPQRLDDRNFCSIQSEEAVDFFSCGGNLKNNAHGLVEDGMVTMPDLLDRLIFEDKFEKKCASTQAMENILKLLALQDVGSTSEMMMEERPITKNNLMNSCSSNSSPNYVMKPIPRPPMNLKVPPAYHPPAISSNNVAVEVVMPAKQKNTRAIRRNTNNRIDTKGNAVNVDLRMKEVEWQLKLIDEEREKTALMLIESNSGLRMILFDYDRISSKELSQVDSLALASLKVHVRMYKLFEAMPKLDRRCGFYKIPEEFSEWKNLAIHIIELRKGKSKNYPGMDIDRKIEKAYGRLCKCIRIVRTCLWSMSMKESSLSVMQH